jgi:hypothetical protein
MGGSPTSCLNLAEKDEHETLRCLASISTVHGSSGSRCRSTRARTISGSLCAPNQPASAELLALMQDPTAWRKRISDKRVMVISAGGWFMPASDLTTFTMAGEGLGAAVSRTLVNPSATTIQRCRSGKCCDTINTDARTHNLQEEMTHDS